MLLITCRLGTLIVKVARPWAGLVGVAPHGVTHSRGRGAGVFAPLMGVCIYDGIMRRKKGGVNGLGKLRKAILTF